jgi:diaminopimelate decarboxylase
MKLSRIVEKYSTPFYLVDPRKAKENLRGFVSSFPENAEVAYAVKANYTPSLIRVFNDNNTLFDTFSVGEVL